MGKSNPPSLPPSHLFYPCSECLLLLPVSVSSYTERKGKNEALVVTCEVAEGTHHKRRSFKGSCTLYLPMKELAHSLPSIPFSFSYSFSFHFKVDCNYSNTAHTPVFSPATLHSIINSIIIFFSLCHGIYTCIRATDLLLNIF